MYDRSISHGAASYSQQQPYKHGAQAASGQSSVQRQSHNRFTPYDYNKSTTLKPTSTSVNASQSFTPYGTSDRRAGHQGHQIYNPSIGDSNNSRAGRNTLQNNASLIMNQNGTASSSNINMGSPNTTKSSHDPQNPQTDSFRQRHGNLYERGARGAGSNIVSGGGAATG